MPIWFMLLMSWLIRSRYSSAWALASRSASSTCLRSRRLDGAEHPYGLTCLVEDYLSFAVDYALGAVWPDDAKVDAVELFPV
jgi:hypothetical protein